METAQTSTVTQSVPVKLFRTSDRLTVAAPMPGILPDDLLVEVDDRGQLTLHGDAREGRKPEDFMGPRHEPREVLMDEWRAGGYHRQLALPQAVDGELATLTLGNGVLVVALPVSAQTRPARLTLERVGPGRGERVGSAGHPIQPATTEEHWETKRAVWQAHGGARVFDP
jgi:HSP20 family protein